jgi:hypothetical protein
VSIDILGDGVNHDIGTVVQRILDVRAHKSVVNDDQNATLVRSGGDFADINKSQRRV